ncbi:MAG: hypothetical protein GWO02_22015 [Gammaproteobacteria bacterium]|nr:hypothetical protein [Gammaproteobacteria bacterium]
MNDAAANKAAFADGPQNQYRLTSIEPADPPPGTGQTWYAYVLENNDCTIKGQRRGTRAEVTEHAREFAEELNARAGRGYRPAWSAQRKGGTR